MITLLIISYSVVAFLLGLYFELLEYSVLTLQLFGIYTLSCLLDGIFGLFALRQNVGRRGTRGALRQPLTWVGRYLQNYQEVISYRINTLSNQVEAASPQAEVNTPEPTVLNEEKFFDQTLSELESAFRATGCAVIVQEQEQQERKVFLKGIRGKRLEDQLRRMYSEWFFRGESKWLGLIDTLEPSVLNEELSAFGLRYSLSSSFNLPHRKGILWLGFGMGKEPLQKDQERLDTYSKKLEREINTFVSVQELRSRVNEAEEVSQARTDFLTHISHDIKSPLNNVKAILSLLRDEGLETNDSQQLVNAALRNCDSVAELVNSLIDFAKHRSGKLTATKVAFNLTHLAEEVAQSFELSAKAKGLTFGSIMPVGEVRCLADKTHVRRILSNLIGNAIKYTASGRVDVGIRARDEHSWIINVADSGPGFTDKQLKELFTPFARFDTQGAEGAGLGLTVSRILAELNGGSIEVQSIPGEGSEFVLAIPAAAASLQDPTATVQDKIIDFSTIAQHISQQKPIQRLEGLKILVVDDDPDATQGLARLLAKEGAEISQALTVPDAISIANFDRPDVLITDSNMPDGGGRRLIKFARLQLPGLAVVVVTGDVSNSEELIALGAACVMDKPVHISELIDYLEDILHSGQQKVVGQ